ncbi:hypothetical protein HLB23_20890 [Nocardia uniformis]|uniref:Cupin domain-containing protein n=1 Tax=Nocardia uniformis TaxID=53432 RepID=A0A849C3V9_9NOCA|nr:hypothetical protein [Nocardia uniformis]NNH72286.1 hypothetical protein [Nocardia uniformis]
MGIRRVVTGHDSTGKAIVVSDGEVPPGGRGPDSIWGADGPLTFPDAGGRPEFAGPLIPQPGGFHIIRIVFPPHFNPDDWADTTDPVRAAASAREQMAASVALVDDPNPPGTYGAPAGFTGLHATASMDCMMQVSGESVCVLEDAEIRLRPGDWLVLNGVVHAWRNDGDEDAALIGVVIGAEHKGAPRRG